MKRIKIAFAATALMIGSAAAFASTNFANEKYQIINDGGTYWVLGQEVTGQVPGPSTYECTLSAQNCTAEADATKIFISGSELRVLKTDATRLAGTFVDH